MTDDDSEVVFMVFLLFLDEARHWSTSKPATETPLMR